MLYDPRTKQLPKIRIDKDGHVSTLDHQDAVGNIMGKLGIAWVGFFAGISLSDLALLATLVYTSLQIGILMWEKVIKPWRRRRYVRHTGKSVPETSPAPLNSGD